MDVVSYVGKEAGRELYSCFCFVLDCVVDGIHLVLDMGKLVPEDFSNNPFVRLGRNWYRNLVQKCIKSGAKTHSNFTNSKD